MLSVYDWKTEKWDFINTIGIEIIPCKYDTIDWFPSGGKHELFGPPKPFTHGFARVMINGEWIQINKDSLVD